MKEISNKFHQEAPTILTFLDDFSGSFNPCPSLLSVATDDRKKFQCLNIVVNDKTGPLFWNYIDAKKFLAFLKGSKSREIAPMNINIFLIAFPGALFITTV